jgi:hypothetical protein
MREIKFRALVEDKDTKVRHWEYYSTLSEPAWLDCYNIIVKDLQYTGLKGKNDKEIWEGDILKNNSGRITQVFWDKHCAMFDITVLNTKGIPRLLNDRPDILQEIIGNIYENPELLKENKNGNN